MLWKGTFIYVVWDAKPLPGFQSPPGLLLPFLQGFPINLHFATAGASEWPYYRMFFFIQDVSGPKARRSGIRNLYLPMLRSIPMEFATAFHGNPPPQTQTTMMIQILPSHPPQRKTKHFVELMGRDVSKQKAKQKHQKSNLNIPQS